MDTWMTSLFSRRVQWHFSEERIGNLQKILAAFNGPGLVSRGVIIENNTFNTRLRLRSQRVDHFQSLFMQEFDKVHSLFTQPSTEAKQSHLTFVQSLLQWGAEWPEPTELYCYLQLGEYTTNRSGRKVSNVTLL